MGLKALKQEGVVLIRLWLVVIVLTVISWLVLKLVQKSIHLGWLFLFWVVAVFGTTLLLYGLSVLLAGV